MNILKIQCEEPHFEETEQFLFGLELNQKPWFDTVKLICGGDSYTYQVQEEFGKFYITT